MAVPKEDPVERKKSISYIMEMLQKMRADDV